MATQKQYLDYAGLQEYDRLIKNLISTEDAKSIKNVVWNADQEQIEFYKTADASGEPFKTVKISSADVNALKTRVGMGEGISLNTYQSKTNLTEIVNILTGVDTVDGSLAKAVKDVKKYTDDAVNALDTTADVTTASVSDGVVTLTASIAEENGLIKKGSASNITLAKVATTGTAADVTVADSDGKYAASNVEEALKEVKVEANDNKADIATLNSDVNTTGSVLKMIKDNAKDAIYTAATEGKEAVTIAQGIANAEAAAKTASIVNVVKQETAESGYAATYYVTQAGTQVGTKINIPKDFLVKSAELKTVTTADQPYEGAAVGDKYIDFVINAKDASATAEHLYLPVNDLFDSYTSGSVAGDMVVVTVDNTTNKISAAITDGTVTRAKITSGFESDIAKVETALEKAADGTYKTVSTRIDEQAADATYTAASEGVAKVTIKEAIAAVDTKITTEIQKLDATVSQSGVIVGETDGNGLNLSITEVDGKITAISGSIERIPETGTNSIASLFTD